MRVLALDTTTRAGSVAVVENGRVIFALDGDPARSHAERLPQELLDALAASRLTVADVDVFGVASGPGSFTGLRIGLAAIQGMAMVAGKRVVAVSALDALGAAAAERVSSRTLVGAWIDALRHDVFSALYQVDPGDAAAPADVSSLEEPHVGAPATVLERWRERGQLPSLILGDGAMRYASLLDGVAAVAPLPPLAPWIGRLAALRAAHATSPAGLQPLYVRRTDVEIARDRAAADTSSGTTE